MICAAAARTQFLAIASGLTLMALAGQALAGQALAGQELVKQAFASQASTTQAITGQAGPDPVTGNERRIALVIGNSAYENVPALPNPVRDAAAIAELLEGIGFATVHLHRDLGIRALRRALGDFAELARTADIAVFYFAGHGMEVGGTNYLVPVDAVLAREFDVDGEAVSLDRVLAALAPARRLRLAILDACRNNPFLATMRPTSGTRAFARGLARVEPETADTLIAYAAKAGSVALDGGGTLSPFTDALVKHLPAPGVDLRLALGQVRDDVLRATGNQQEPFVYGSLGGSVVTLMPHAKPAAGVSTEVIRELQTELRRVGCYRGAVDGEWSQAARAALEEFNQHLGLDLPVELASLDTLSVVKLRPARVCPLQCQAGYVADGELCVRVCPAGQVRSPGGACAPAPLPAAAASPPASEPAQSPAPKPQQAAVLAPEGVPDVPATPVDGPTTVAAKPADGAATEPAPAATPAGGVRLHARSSTQACAARQTSACQAACKGGSRVACDILACRRGRVEACRARCSAGHKPACESVKRLTARSATRAATPGKALQQQGRQSGGRPPYPRACRRGDMAGCRANCAAGFVSACNWIARGGPGRGAGRRGAQR